jgi:hypothetical protein
VRCEQVRRCDCFFKVPPAQLSPFRMTLYRQNRNITAYFPAERDGDRHAREEHGIILVFLGSEQAHFTHAGEGTSFPTEFLGRGE